MRNRLFRSSAVAAAVFVAAATQGYGQFAATGTSTVSVAVAPESAISVTTATTSLTEASGAGVFGAPYTGTTNFSYKVRSTKVGGGGTITVKLTADFGVGGPSVTTPAAGDALTYTCTAAVSAAACAGPVTASTAASTTVATFATDAHSTPGAGSADAGTVVWKLPNDPLYKTGTYTATATFTISAT